MVKLIDRMSAPMKIVNEVNSAMAGSAGWQDHDMERLIIDNSASFSVREYAHKLSTKKLLADADIASNPNVLLEVQRSVLDYSLQMSLASALTRKAIGALEGLLRG